jgi:hypothetical protein
MSGIVAYRPAKDVAAPRRIDGLGLRPDPQAHWTLYTEILSGDPDSRFPRGLPPRTCCG